MPGGDLWKALAWTATVATVAVLTTAMWIVADKEAIEEFFGDWPLVPGGLAAPRTEPVRGGGHERESAACEDRTRHGEGFTP